MTSDPPERTEAQQFEFAMQVAFNLLEARQRSEQELRQALTRRNVPEPVGERVLERLRELRYVDDEAFARTLAANRVARSGHGRGRIRQELRAKGVEPEVASAALLEVEPGDEWEAARGVAAKRARSMRNLERHVALRRLQGALARRGFSSDIVLAVSKEVLAGLDSAEDEGTGAL